MKIINKVDVKAVMSKLNNMAIAKVVESDFAKCPMCRVSDG